ncbi:LysR family transcriptional regulator [Ruegeria arenilitoris]|uniref:LysR family transcriptional regulator n=1 Tax=Ruegeria arenilitoris TaxID=1173585 RepID=UPI00147F1C31|nr:LysR family transcriptional regulator [Ruegeria arenilitoris]
MTKLDLRHFQAILALRDHNTTVAAATHLGLSQSAISHQLKEAERRLGCKLFNRSGRLLHLTTSGESIASSAERILAEIARLERGLNPGAKAEPNQVIRIATFAYSAFRWLPAFFKDIQRDTPGLEFEFVSTATGARIEVIECGQADLGIVAGDVAADEIHAIEIFSDDLVCILPKAHPLAKKAYVTAEDFMADPFITYSMYGEAGLEEELLWSKAGIRPRLVNAGHTDAVIEMVKAGFGLSILSRWAVDAACTEGEVESVPITSTGLSIQWSAAYRKSHPEFEALTQIAMSLRNWCATARFPK